MNYYCKYCGTKASSISSLTGSSCSCHPSGPHKGKHALYEGAEKAKYECKYCGTGAPSISSLTGNTCSRHPLGSHKGKHEPAM
jgi:DNA-directed RNA polymerase subunit RPC12/RpoP